MHLDKNLKEITKLITKETETIKEANKFDDLSENYYGDPILIEITDDDTIINKILNENNNKENESSFFAEVVASDITVIPLATDENNENNNSAILLPHNISNSINELNEIDSGDLPSVDSVYIPNSDGTLLNL